MQNQYISIAVYSALVYILNIVNTKLIYFGFRWHYLSRSKMVYGPMIEVSYNVMKIRSTCHYNNTSHFSIILVFLLQNFLHTISKINLYVNMMSCNVCLMSKLVDHFLSSHVSEYIFLLLRYKKKISGMFRRAYNYVITT